MSTRWPSPLHRQTTRRVVSNMRFTIDPPHRAQLARKAESLGCVSAGWLATGCRCRDRQWPARSSIGRIRARGLWMIFRLTSVAELNSLAPMRLAGSSRDQWNRLRKFGGGKTEYRPNPRSEHPFTGPTPSDRTSWSAIDDPHHRHPAEIPSSYHPTTSPNMVGRSVKNYHWAGYFNPSWGRAEPALG